MAKKSGRGGKKPVAIFSGTGSGPLRIEVRITDQFYTADVLDKDIKHGRVWFEGPQDDGGWMKLYFSADGPTGDPFPIGHIRFSLDRGDLSGRFGNVTRLKLKREDDS